MREHILHMLAEAAEMEHNLLCTYLYAAFSLRDASEGLSPDEAKCVSGWRRSIMDIAVQEMGHLVTVNNLMIGLGAMPHLDRPNFPVPRGYLPSGFGVRLAPFDEATLEHFIFLERPEDAPIEDPAPFRDDNNAPRAAGVRKLTPFARDYETIGDLYGTIRGELRKLAAKRGTDAFVRSDRQISGQTAGMDGVVTIEDLPTALTALQKVVEEGEGGQGSADSHFSRFCRIREEWKTLKARNPHFQPAHPSANDPVMRKPEPGLERVWITASPAAETVDLGNAIYAVLMTLVAQLFQPVQQKAVMGAAIDVMHALGRAGKALARLPASNDLPGVNAGLTFAAPRARGPRAGLSLIAERLADLAPEYERLFPAERNPLRDALAGLSSNSVP